MNAMKVLVATDGSPCAHEALDLVANIPWPEGSCIDLVTVVDRATAAYAPSIPGAVPDPVEREVPLIGGLAQDLDREAQPLRDNGLTVDTHVLLGRPATAIVEQAEAANADVIVVGSRGHGTIGSMVLGSVSAEVADHAHCPVLVARSAGWQRAMVAVDGSDFSARAENVVASWPIFAALAVDVVSVAQTDLTIVSSLAMTGYPGSVDFPEEKQAITAEHERFANEARDRLALAGLKVHALVPTGDPAAQLLRAARERATDVIVVGTHGRTGVLRALAGSVARNVMLHARCSVLVVRETRPS
jgi:nucleotide-binding universal stress UspA family protein